MDSSSVEAALLHRSSSAPRVISDCDRSKVEEVLSEDSKLNSVDRLFKLKDDSVRVSLVNLEKNSVDLKDLAYSFDLLEAHVESLDESEQSELLEKLWKVNSEHDVQIPALTFIILADDPEQVVESTLEELESSDG